jgi:hypothetical protein
MCESGRRRTLLVLNCRLSDWSFAMVARLDRPSTTAEGHRTDEVPFDDADVVSERLARFMFDLQADDYDALDAMRELAWADDDIRAFWFGQADAVISFLGLEAA